MFMSELASVGLGNSGALAESAIRAIAGRQRVNKSTIYLGRIWGGRTFEQDLEHFDHKFVSRTPEIKGKSR